MQPEKITASEAELLTLAKKLKDADLNRIIIQVRALAYHDKHEYYEWLEEQENGEINPGDI